MYGFLRRLRVTRLLAYAKAFREGLTLAQRLKFTRLMAYILVCDAIFVMACGFYLLHIAWSNNDIWLVRLAELGSIIAFGFAICFYRISIFLFVRLPVLLQKKMGNQT